MEETGCVITEIGSTMVNEVACNDDIFGFGPVLFGLLVIFLTEWSPVNAWNGGRGPPRAA
jgi:urea transporter